MFCMVFSSLFIKFVQIKIKNFSSFSKCFEIEKNSVFTQYMFVNFVKYIEKYIFVQSEQVEIIF